MRAEPAQLLGPAQRDEGATFCMVGGAAPRASNKLMQRRPSGGTAPNDDEALQLPTMHPVSLLQPDPDAEHCCGVCLQPPSALPQCVRHSPTHSLPFKCTCLFQAKFASLWASPL